MRTEQEEYCDLAANWSEEMAKDIDSQLDDKEIPATLRISLAMALINTNVRYINPEGLKELGRQMKSFSKQVDEYLKKGIN